MPLQTPQFNYLNYGQAINQGNRAAAGQANLQQTAREMQEYQQNAPRREQSAKMDMQIKGYKIINETIKRAGDQPSWENAISSLTSQGLMKPGELPQKFDPALRDRMLGLTEAKLKNQPSSVREFEYYQNLPQTGQQTFMGLKRADKTLNLGDRVVTVGPQGEKTYTRGVPTEKTPEHVGAVTEEKETRKVMVKRKKNFSKTKKLFADQTRQWGLLEKSIEKAIKSTGVTTAGFAANIAGVKGTPQYNLARLLETIKANLGFDKLQQMRDASPTGGALGQVSEMENRLLQAVKGSLDQGQDADVLKENLEIILEDLKSLKLYTKQSYEQEYSDLLGMPQNPQTGQFNDKGKERRYQEWKARQ